MPNSFLSASAPYCILFLITFLATSFFEAPFIGNSLKPMPSVKNPLTELKFYMDEKFQKLWDTWVRVGWKDRKGSGGTHRSLVDNLNL